MDELRICIDRFNAHPEVSPPDCRETLSNLERTVEEFPHGKKPKPNEDEWVVIRLNTKVGVNEQGDYRVVSLPIRGGHQHRRKFYMISITDETNNGSLNPYTNTSKIDEGLILFLRFSKQIPEVPEKKTNGKMTKEGHEKILKAVKLSHKYLSTIDQYLHNTGLNKLERLNMIKHVIVHITESELHYKDIGTETLMYVKDIISEVLLNVPISEISQQLFMFYGSVLLKNSLDQFYTPITISSFINSVVLRGKSCIDPAGGTGDLLVEIDGTLHVWEISEDAITMAQLNYDLRDKRVHIKHADSLREDIDVQYDYCIMNPPFGTKTVTHDKTILDRFELGQNQDKQELGILFIELGFKLIREGGLLFTIIPGGYLGNNSNKFLREYLIRNSRIISIIKLPASTFSRSGTGVSTYLVIMKKTADQAEDYDIHLAEISEIGYDLNKKNTPIKFKTNSDGTYILDESDNLMIDNDFDILTKELSQFSYDKKISGMVNDDPGVSYDSVHIKEILSEPYNIMEVGYYNRRYKQMVQQLKMQDHIAMDAVCVSNVDYSFEIDEQTTYKYIDISEVKTPLYNGKYIRGSKLPGRAKHLVLKDDIIISRLRGNISFSVIMEDNVLVTSGMCVIRPNDKKSLIMILGNMYTEGFRVQHQSLTTGSVMECISDGHIHEILLKKDIDCERFTRIYDAMNTLHHELSDVASG